MGARPFDFVIFGATGVTGLVFTKIFSSHVAQSSTKIQWAIAGRSKQGLENVERALITDNLPLPQKIFVADVSEPESLDKMASSCIVLFNLTGPYRFYGEPVVKSCVENCTHYIDICGEPQFIETMFLKYNDLAMAAGVTIMHACGFDSIPAELCYLVACSCSEELGRVEMYLSMKSHSDSIPMCFHSTTFQAAIYSMSDYPNLLKIRREINAKYNITKRVEDKDRKKKAHNAPVTWSSVFNKYYMVFPGADSAIIQFTHLYLSQVRRDTTTWPRFHAYALLTSSMFGLVLFLVMGFIVKFLANFAFARKIMSRNPEIFTCGMFTTKGPSEEQMRNQYFTSEFLCYSPDNVQIVKRVKLTGPDPGYLGTSYLLLFLSKIFIRNLNAFPRGVITPGIGLRVADKVNEYVEELRNSKQFEFEVTS